MLITTMTILLVILLPKSQARQHPNREAILRWNRTGITIVGITGQYGNSSNLLFGPRGLHIDWSYSLYVTDTENNRIQKYARNSLIGQTVAGQSSGLAGSGSTFLTIPCDIKVDIDGNIYVADTNNHRIQLWKQGSSTGLTIVGTTGIFRQYTTNFNIVFPKIIVRLIFIHL